MRKGSSWRMLGAIALAVATIAAVPIGLGGPAAVGSAFNTVPIRSSVPTPFGSVSAPFLVGKNVDITRRNGAQSETAIAINPTDPTNILASQNDLTDTARIYESHDSGATWGPSGLVLSPSFCYDTWIDFNANGDAFVSYECSDERIAYRKHGTTNWVKFKFTNAGSFPDRDMVVVDTTPASPFFGSVYVGYDDNGNNNAAHLMISRDGFGAWSQSPKINQGNPTIGVNAAVGPTGTVYATWEDYSGKKIFTDKSSDGGVTWGTDHVVTNFRINTTTFFISIPPQNSRGVLPMPMTTVAPAGSPNAGRLYVTYFDKAVATTNTNVYFRYSDDGGTTWSAEKQLNDDTNNAWHFHPQIAVAPNGTIGVSFYDTRNDPNDKKTDRYVTYSTDGGVTWSANTKVTTAMSDETVNFDANQYGDYQNMDASPDNSFILTWTDSRIPALDEEQAAARTKP